MKKWLLILSYIAVIFIAYYYRAPLLEWIENKDSTHIPFSFLLLTFVAIFPVVPFTVAAGVMGAKYGIVIGGLINLASSTIAAILMFLFFRYGFAVEGRQWLAKWKMVDRFTEIVEKNAFMAVLFGRLIPIVPAPAVNLYSAISRMKLSSYALASLIGKIPVMTVFAVIGDQFFEHPRNILYVLLFYSLFIVITYTIYWKWRKVRPS